MASARVAFWLLVAAFASCSLAGSLPTTSAAIPQMTVAILAPDTSQQTQPSCMPAGSAIVPPLNASLLALQELRAEGTASWTPKIVPLSSAPTSVEFQTAVNLLASQGVKYVLDWSMDSDVRRLVTPIMQSNGMVLWSARDSMEECSQATFSTGRTPNVALSPPIAWMVVRQHDRGA
jgi:hypothetical protein